MGVPGMILSPVVLNYLRVEMSKMEATPAVALSERATVEVIDGPH
jgi:hypothetical protein